MTELHKEATLLMISFEIIVADDASNEEIKQQNRAITKLTNCSYLELEKNKGRAQIKNLLVEQAKYKYILFADCDAGLATHSFLKTYINSAKTNEVICGGLLYPRPMPSANVSLRYHYGISSEERTAEERNLYPYLRFSSFNVFMPKETFQHIRFDETFTQYGHEDTAFGIELEKRGIQVNHINNPLYHLGLEDNKTFLQKTEVSIRTLIQKQDLLSQHVRLLHLYNSYKKRRITSFPAFIFRLSKPILLRNLLGKSPNMVLFAFYKLGYLCNIENSLSKDK